MVQPGKGLFLFIVLITVWLAGCGRNHWEIEDNETLTAGPLLDQDRLYVASSSYGVSRAVIAYDARSGREHWRLSAGDWEDCPDLVVRNGQGVVVCGALAEGFDAVTGVKRWRVALSGPLEVPLSLQDGVAVMLVRLPEGGLELFSLAADTGAPILRQTLSGDSRVSRLAGALIVTSAGSITAFDPATGQHRWSGPLPEPAVRLVGSAAGLFVVTGQRLTGYDPLTGRQKWSRPTDAQVSPSALDGLVSFAQGGVLLGVDAETGLEKWRHRLSGVVDPPALTHNVVYVHSAGGTLHALSSVDGEPLWKLAIGAPGRYPTLNDEFYAWVTTGEIRIVDLVRRQALPSIPLKGLETADEEDPSSWPVHTPLLLNGPMLYGVERAHRLFMVDLEP